MLRITTDTLMYLLSIMADTCSYHALAKKQLVCACILIHFINYTSKLKRCKYSSHAKHKVFGEHNGLNREKL